MVGDSQGIAITPDGRSLFLAGLGVRAFRRDLRTGALSPVVGLTGCLDLASDGCAGLRGPKHDPGDLDDTNGIAVSPDARDVYVLGSTGVAVLLVDPATGGLVQVAGRAGCLGGVGGCLPSPRRASFAFSSIAMSADGAFVYTTSDSLVLRRDESTGTLSVASTVPFRGLGARPSGLALSPDGREAYMADDVVGLITMKRDATSGALSRARGSTSCLSDPTFVQIEPTCRAVSGFAGSGPFSVAITPDGRFVYTAAEGHGFALSAFARRPGDGALRQLPGRAGCTATYVSARCAETNDRVTLPQISVSPDGHNAYVLSNGSENGLVAIFALQR